jgi:hypothetical protein
MWSDGFREDAVDENNVRHQIWQMSLRRFKHRKGITVMSKDDVTIESDIKTVESMLGIDEKQVWAYQRLEEAMERLKPHYNVLDEHAKGIFNLGLLELSDAAQAGEQW